MGNATLAPHSHRSPPYGIQPDLNVARPQPATRRDCRETLETHLGASAYLVRHGIRVRPRYDEGINQLIGEA